MSVVNSTRSENYSSLDIHKFVDMELAKNGFKILTISKELMDKRVDDFMKFVNGIRAEYKDIYGWNSETEEYFLNGLVDKWKYSFSILNSSDEICFVNFSSVYGDIIHNHCTYGRKDTRNFNFAKLHIIKLCQTGLDNGFKYQEGYWPKNNNRSIILFLKMGWQIESIRNNEQLFMKADLEKVRNQTYELVISDK
ncbi:MAG: hypothetical protein L0Y79_12925 [Chlorobi bacterium]|nr:hypothetical protein [Chlorobiota bacterium]MCI0714857.1 hypothetical protein [Chlorobiota bacterium]